MGEFSSICGLPISLMDLCGECQHPVAYNLVTVAYAITSCKLSCHSSAQLQGQRYSSRQMLSGAVASSTFLTEPVHQGPEALCEQSQQLGLTLKHRPYPGSGWGIAVFQCSGRLFHC